jgi:RimJ/RimL family protein N-acetyltransferase
MQNTHVISIEDHLEWIKNLKSNNRYFAIFMNEKIVGNVNYTDFDNNKKSCYWGCYFSENTHSFIVSASTIFFLDYVFNTIDVKTLNLFTKRNNHVALNFDKNLGFKPYNEDKEYIYMSQLKSDWNNLKEERTFQSIFAKMEEINFKIEQ